MHAKSFLPRQVRQAHRPIGQIDIFFDAPCCTANFRLYVLNINIKTALIELVQNRLTLSVFTACTRFLDKAVVYMTAPNARFVPLSRPWHGARRRSSSSPYLPTFPADRATAFVPSVFKSKYRLTQSYEFFGERRLGRVFDNPDFAHERRLIKR